MKTILKILIWGSLLLSALLFLEYFCKYETLNTYNQQDINNFNKFQSNLDSEIYNIVDKNIDSFVEEIVGLKSIFFSLTDFTGITNNKKEELVAEAWDKCFSEDIKDAIQMRVQILVEDLYKTNELCIKDFEKQGVRVKGFDKKIKQDFENMLRNCGINIGNQAIQEAVKNQAIGLCATSLVSAVIKLCKFHGWIAIVVTAVEPFITDYFVEKNTKIKLKQEIVRSIKGAMYSKYGLYEKMNSNLVSFHESRSKAYRDVLIDDVSDKVLKFFDETCENIQNMYNYVDKYLSSILKT